MELPGNSKVIFRGIVGSQSYGLATETSDTDYKTVFIQSDEDILSNRYIGQVDINKDDVAYELRRFLELISVGNPNVLELLYLPKYCIVESSPEWEYLISIRSEFLTMKCYDTFSGYGRSQLRKSKGLNKKFNWEEDRKKRKTILDFCRVFDREFGMQWSLKDFLDLYNLDQSKIGLVYIDKFRDLFKVYIGDNYRGIGDEKTNEPKKSEVSKEEIPNWSGLLYFNKEKYSHHCNEYKEYEKWLKNRNENRVATNKLHGQQMDGKNILHLVRLIMTAEEIPTEKTINVDRSKDREYLLSIKNGKVDLKEIIEKWSKRVDNLKDIYKKSDLKESVDIEFTNNLELKIRSFEL